MYNERQCCVSWPKFEGSNCLQTFFYHTPLNTCCRNGHKLFPLIVNALSPPPPLPPPLTHTHASGGGCGGGGSGGGGGGTPIFTQHGGVGWGGRISLGGCSHLTWREEGGRRRAVVVVVVVIFVCV